jgi:Pyruvate/2-oxoacid:ferredoxin oxidoreductase delta subunit
MAIRHIVKIDESKCDGCGLCVTACAEGAIQIIDGKARLVSETYCDGLGACLGHCPQDAITIEQREAAEFDEAATEAYLKTLQAGKAESVSQPKAAREGGFVCPGARMMQLNQAAAAKSNSTTQAGDRPSQLAQWPVQLHLVSPTAPYFAGADLVLTADCVPFAMADFHETLLAGRAIAIACPKLDDTSPYVEKLAELIKHNNLKRLTVVHMEVPCCTGLVRIAQQAMAQAQVDVPFRDVTISLQGQIK